MPNLWPHQLSGIDDTIQAIRSGSKSIVIASPTGAGKTLMQAVLAQRAKNKQRKVLLLTNRRVLIDQLSGEFAKSGVEHGIIASGHKRNVFPLVQLAMAQTVFKRAFDDNRLLKPEPDVVIVDEGHSHQNPTSQAIIQHALDHGAIVLYFTATPVGMGATCDSLITAGKYSQLQRDGILVPVDVYAPTEVDMSELRQTKGEWSERKMAERVRECGVFGDIFEHWEKLNPWHHPTAVFAPGVDESKWIVKVIFREQGIGAWHIDGDTPESERQDCFDALVCGDISVISSCGVLREGWNCPAVRHAILLQVCGRLSTYLQIAGRIMRCHPGKDRAVLQDHTGAWHRHGPPDMDRDWELNEDDTHAASERRQSIESGKVREGIVCPKCHAVRLTGPKCFQCGYQHERSVRFMRQKDGTLKKMSGQVYTLKKPRTTADKWRSQLFAGYYSDMTVGQCIVMYHHKHDQWPPEDELPKQVDRKRKVEHVYPWVKRADESRRKGAA